MLLFDSALLPAQPAQRAPLADGELKAELEKFHDWAVKEGKYDRLSLADRQQLFQLYKDLLSKPEFAMGVSEARYWVAAFMYREPTAFFTSIVSPKPALVEHYKLAAPQMEAMVGFATAAFKDPSLALEIKKFDETNGGANTGIVCFLSAQLNYALSHEEKVPASQGLSSLMALAENTLGDRTGALFDKLLKTPPLAHVPPLA